MSLWNVDWDLKSGAHVRTGIEADSKEEVIKIWRQRSDAEGEPEVRLVQDLSSPLK